MYVPVPLCASVVRVAFPPLHIVASAGWSSVGSFTTVTVTVFEVASPQPLPDADTMHLYW